MHHTPHHAPHHAPHATPHNIHTSPPAPAQAGAIKINLKGTSVGNGLTNPSVQYKYYTDMIVSTNDHKAAVGKVVHGIMQAARRL